MIGGCHERTKLMMGAHEEPGRSRIVIVVPSTNPFVSISEARSQQGRW